MPIGAQGYSPKGLANAKFSKDERGNKMALNKKCIHCSSPLSYRVLLKQTTVINCPHCKEALYSTLSTRFAFSLIFIVTFSLILMNVNSNSIKSIVITIWIMISFFVVQPFVLRYK